MPKGDKKCIEWCGPCWIEGDRQLSAAKIGKLPLCANCLTRYGSDSAEVARLYKAWDAMPDFDTGDSAMAAFNNFMGRVLR